MHNTEIYANFANKKVSNMTKKGKHTVLFICLGNICRSPAAEGIMKSLVEKAGLQDEFEIDSAGIGGWHAKTTVPLPPWLLQSLIGKK
ncbi:Low molecular weight protein-tyrosine-phosphatase yfkJ [Segatella copri]|nr:Low molecular weight protein-tyrosine-phosphatase yfkJ [Segatella copri]